MTIGAGSSFGSTAIAGFGGVGLARSMLAGCTTGSETAGCGFGDGAAHAGSEGGGGLRVQAAKARMDARMMHLDIATVDATDRRWVNLAAGSLHGPDMRTVRATRYLTPLREGGSMPAIVEADDEGTYVIKWRGAAQGERALIAEIVAAELARVLGLPVPHLVLIEIDPMLARSEPDQEIQHLLRASAGQNVALDYLPGALNYEPALAPPPDAELAARIVWFDAFISNVDRTVRNPNLLRWHKQVWLIDHGAALYFHHDWAGHLARSDSHFAKIKQHVLMPQAGDIRVADAALAPLVTEAVLTAVLAHVPDAWLTAEATPEATRAGYVEHLLRRLGGARAFVEEAERARVL